MFKSIYKKIAEDFAFISEYGYHAVENIEHYVHPSVLFTSDKVKLRIGYDYDDDQIYLRRLIPADSYNGENLLKGIYLKGKSYKDQVEQAKEILRKILDDWIR